MKKWLLLAGLLVLLFVLGCNEKVVLSDFQAAACNSAASNNNCGKLTDLGLVTASQCCSAMGKCCVGLTGSFVKNLDFAE
jgi:hypothetical protein